MMVARKERPRSNDEIREILLQYFYDRNHNARSELSDKSGSAVKISIVNRELKASHRLTQPEIRSNLNYLISQGWVDRVSVTRHVSLPSGAVYPQQTPRYQISAAGIDKIEGPSRFTMPTFHGINLEVTGQNIITVGNGNQVNAQYGSLAQDLASFEEEVRGSEELTELQKLGVVADIETIQSQLAKPTPNGTVLQAVWAGIEKIAVGTGLAANAASIASHLSTLF